MKPNGVWKATSPVARIERFMCSALPMAVSKFTPSASATSARPVSIICAAWSNASPPVMPLPTTSITTPLLGRRR
ncbi:hypothetical protein Y695_01680 [Hydrogenophaga sp. T4]|nr:hypothetical protein Y695_01680 [Hydrogenophaga sp. T4]